MTACGPQGRCAAVLLYGRHLAVLPAGGSEAADLNDDELAAAAFDEGAGISRRPAGTPAALDRSYLIVLAALAIREARAGNWTWDIQDVGSCS